MYIFCAIKHLFVRDEKLQVDSRLITENEEIMFEAINAPLEQEEVARLKDAANALAMEEVICSFCEKH
jgi:hypothetical protein